MTPEDEQAIRQGMEAAQRQLMALAAQATEVLKQAAQLIEQQHALGAYIAQAASVLGESTSAMASSVSAAHDFARQIMEGVAAGRQAASQNLSPGDGERPLWREAAWILARAQRPLTVPEIVEAMKTAGKQLTGDNVTEVLRVALNRKLGIFETVSRGRYALKTWPREWKVRERDVASPQRDASPVDPLFLSERALASLREVGVVKVP